MHYQRYIKQVKSGKRLAGELEQLAVERFENDLKRKDIYFDQSAANNAVEIISNIVIGKEYDEDGNENIIKFKLEPFQAFIVANIFGWKNKKNNRRRFRYAYIEMARKNGKSTLAAAIALLFFLAEYSAEVYTIATKRDQAKIVFQMIKKLVLQTDWLSREISVQQHNISILSKFSKIEALSSDARKQDGTSPSCTICDEYHEHPNDAMYNVMKSGMGARKQPMLFTITTAGFDKSSACYQLRGTCVSILRGQLTDDSMFVMIFTIDEQDDWEDVKVWEKSNPSMGVTIEKDFLVNEWNQAKNTPSQIVNFKTKNLNVWTQASSVWIKDKDWMACGGKLDLEKLKGRKAYGGLDLAKSIDINALCLIFPDESKVTKFDVLWWYWIPEEKVIENRDNINYTQWVEEGYIEATPGREVDYSYIVSRIAKIYEDFDIQGIAYDPYMANNSIVQDLEKEHSIELTTFPQGFKYLSVPTSYIENLVVGKRLRHGDNPVSRWMCGNVELQSNPEGLIKMSKSKSKNKIDGMYALANAIALYINEEENDFNEIIQI